VIAPTSAWLLYAMICPAIPANSPVHAVTCAAEPARSFSTFAKCWTARDELKQADGTIAACIDVSRLHSDEWREGWE
jgi:hypothetical protein